jgi:predicted nucleic acid-binding Zn finger protein
MYVLLCSPYSENGKMRVFFLVIGRGNKVIVPLSYCVTEGCVT